MRSADQVYLIAIDGRSCMVQLQRAITPNQSLSFTFLLPNITYLIFISWSHPPTWPRTRIFEMKRQTSDQIESIVNGLFIYLFICWTNNITEKSLMLCGVHLLVRGWFRAFGTWDTSSSMTWTLIYIYIYIYIFGVAEDNLTIY